MKLVILGILILSMFAGNVDASFLDDEAGISAYTKATTTITLNNAKSAFRTIETQTSNYIIGSVPIPGLPESEDAHVYVSKSGWILAYYKKDLPTAKMLQWSGYAGGSISTTTLADAISSLASSAGVSYSGIKYYNFKYPGANRLMMIVDWKKDGPDSYQFKVPDTFVLNENSHSLYCEYNCWSNIDSVDIPNQWSYEFSGRGVHYGYYGSILSPNVFHTVDFGSYGEGAQTTILVYKQP